MWSHKSVLRGSGRLLSDALAASPVNFFQASNLGAHQGQHVSQTLKRERSQKCKVMKFGNFGSEKCGGFSVAKFVSVFPRKKRLKICHRELHRNLHCKRRDLSPGTHSESVLA